LLPREIPEIVELVRAELGIDVRAAPEPLNPVAARTPVEALNVSLVEVT
jgi:hypothetical protein